jgi:hypothetical protein
MSINYYLEQRRKKQLNEMENVPSKREFLNKPGILTEEMVNVLSYLGI